MSEQPRPAAPDAPSSDGAGRKWLGACAILASCLIVYLPSLGGGFVWDDDTHLLDNPVFEPGGLYAVWFTPPQVINYWPLTFTTYWVEHALWGFEPLGYHVVNVVLHGLAAIVLWGVLHRLRIPLPWFAALVFAIHPVNVESVAWIAQRKNILSLLFFLLAGWFYLRFEVEQKRSLYVGSIVSHLLAMLGKGAAAPFPAVLLLLAWWRRGAVRLRDVWLALPFFMVTALTSLLEISTQVLVADDDTIRGDSFAARLAGAGWVVWFYLGKALWPMDLAFVYPRWTIDPSALASWLPLASGAALLGVLFVTPRRWARPTLVALLFYVLMLSPVLGFFDIYYMRYSFVADHYQYLALVGIVALVVGGTGGWLQARPEFPRATRVALALALVALLGGTSTALSTSYHSAERLWLDTLEKNPDAFLAHYNLALLLQREGRLDEAAVHYRETLRIQNDNTDAMNNLGKVLADSGDLEGAVASYRSAIARDPGFVDPRNNLGVLLQESGSLDRARAVFQEAIEIAPKNAVVHFNYARTLAAAGEHEMAILHFRRAVALDPDRPVLRAGLEQALRRRPMGAGRSGTEAR